MKFIVTFFALVAVASAAQEVLKLSQEIVDKIYKYSTPCAKEHNVDISIVPRLADGTLPRDEATNKFLYCFALNAGYIKEDGHMLVDKLAVMVKGHPLESQFVEALRKCNEVTKEDHLATVAAMNKCFTEGPIRVVISK